MEVYIKKASKKESVTNTLDIELFFFWSRETKDFVCSYIKKCVRGFMLDKKSCDWKMCNWEGLIF